MNRRNTTKRPSPLAHKHALAASLALIERLEPRAMLAGVGPELWSAAAPATTLLGTGTLSSSGIPLACSSPTPGSSGTSSRPAPTTGSGGAPSGGVLWLASASGSVAGSAASGSGTNGTVNTNGPALSSQSVGSALSGGQVTSAAASGFAPSGGGLWLSASAGFGAGTSTTGSTGGVNKDGPALSSQTIGSAGGGMNTNSNAGSGGTVSGADLWLAHGAGAGTSASMSGSTSGVNPKGPALSAQYTSSSGGAQAAPAAASGSGGLPFVLYDASQTAPSGPRSQSGSTGPTGLPLADGQSIATFTPLVYQPGSDDGPVFVTAVWTGDDGGWQIVQVADAATAGESTSDSRGWIGAIGDVAVGVGSYVGRSTKSLVLGDWTDESPTALSIGAGFGLGVVGADLPLDILNLGHTVSHPELSYKWGTRLVINGVAVLPVVGVIKYLKYFDDAGDLAKRADDLSAGSRLAGQWDAGNYPTPPGRSADWTWAPGSSESRTGWRWWDPQGGEWRWHPSDSWHPNGHWDYNPWRTWNDRWRNVDVPSGGSPVASP